jgi:hypothetical protein
MYMYVHAHTHTCTHNHHGTSTRALSPIRTQIVARLHRTIFLDVQMHTHKSILSYTLTLCVYSPHSSFEGFIAPLFLLACLMFPFVIQISEIVSEKEQRLRQALTAVGMYDMSYWLSWHVWQIVLCALQAVLICAFGCAFGFRIFMINDFSVVFITFWLFSLAMSGLAYIFCAILTRSQQAVPVGFAAFLIAFAMYFIINIFNFPFGRINTTEPFGYDYDTASKLAKKNNSDVIVEPIFAVLPPSLLVKAISDLGELSGRENSAGLRFGAVSTYCKLTDMCDPDFSIANIWVWHLMLYVIFSVIGIYLENVIPDQLGACKPVWYVFSARYWGLGKSKVTDVVQDCEDEDVDQDVAAEERAVQARANLPMSQESAIEVRGLLKAFRRGGKEFRAVKAPWYSVGE